ncbi:hypothetical protein ACLIYP_25060 [Streptomyces nanhaiensis]|uniref:hypothetical protein n=1 Tax=Streptomyces nanhaiensis TaxID=679319 RepID=UPI00399CCEDD
MAVPRKGSRRLNVEGVAYRWRVRGRPTYEQGLVMSPLTYAVELAEAPGSTLVVTTGRAHPGNWIGAPADPVLPSQVAAAVLAALARGWAPHRPGSAFHLDQL